jgi:hypothetical protein
MRRGGVEIGGSGTILEGIFAKCFTNAPRFLSMEEVVGRGVIGIFD